MKQGARVESVAFAKIALFSTPTLLDAVGGPLQSLAPTAARNAVRELRHLPRTPCR